MRRGGRAMRGLLLAMALGGPTLCAVESSPEWAFQRANELYRQGRFVEAVDGYQAILARDVENGALYYNLGNALLKSGRKSEALWAYLKAKPLLPRDADLAANLDYAQSLLSSGVASSIAVPRLARWLTLNQRCGTWELAWWMSGLLWLTAILWGIFSWLPVVRRMVRPLAWLASVAVGFSLLALVAQTVWIDSLPRAVVIREVADAKFAPQAGGTTHFTLPEGALVRLLGREFGWAQVKRADGRIGWMPGDALKVL